MSNQKSLGAAEAIHAVAIRILRMVRVADAKAGVGPAQLSALSVLVFVGPKSLGELAAAEQVKSPTMSRIVDGLVHQGLAERQTAASDRRSLRIAATPSGRRLLLRGRNRRVRILAQRIGSCSEADLAVLQKAVQILAEI
ncbi:MAG TPA: MarR family transcriptional regulator [Terriglobales bacterium]|nr:MarR family transcriptional regulator [Terriglobales bacterium]